MADKDKKIDPYDVEALEKSLNDSATRVSTIWVSFLIFSLYLLTAAATVTHRQLFLAEPVKLPVLNIDLPLWGFFFLAPVLFVIFHAYVLIQIILLARTAVAYNEAVDHGIKNEAFNARVRQRLANTLFAQIFAGSPRERQGGFGWLLKSMAWITLVLAPILVLLFFQFRFLPYHSHIVTWTHRLLLFFDLTAVFLFWPQVVNPRRDVRWREVRHWLWRVLEFLPAFATFVLWPLLSTKGWGIDWPVFQQRRELRRLLPQVAPSLGAISFVSLSLALATFPGEPHVSVITSGSLDAVQCDLWVHQNFGRLDLPYVDVVDDERLAKIVRATSERGLRAHDGERTRVFVRRDLACANLASADLRRVDLSEAKLTAANLEFAALEGASLTSARLEDAILSAAQLHGASLSLARLRGSRLVGAELPGATLIGAEFQGANLFGSFLQGAILSNAQLQGAKLNYADLRGANLDGAKLQGASLDNAKLQGSSLNSAELQGASLDEAQLQGASILSASFQGASLRRADLDHSEMSALRILLAEGANCMSARVIKPIPDAAIGWRKTEEGRSEEIPASSAGIEELIASSIEKISDQNQRKAVSRKIRTALDADSRRNDVAVIEEIWKKCERNTKNVEKKDFRDRRIAILRGVACDASSDGGAIGSGITYNSFRTTLYEAEFSTKLARALLGEDGKRCAAARDYNGEARKALRAAAGTPADSAPPAIFE